MLEYNEAHVEESGKVRWDRLAARLFIQSGLLTPLERLEAQRPNVLRILAYHRIDEAQAGRGQLDPALLTATPEAFAEQMGYLVEKYRPLALEELLVALRTGQPLPPGAVLVTVDDGYRDFAEQAWPVLERLGVPTVLFVPTDFMEADAGPFWWDQLYRAVMQTSCDSFTLSEGRQWLLRTQGQRHQVFEGLKRLVQRQREPEKKELIKKLQQQLGVQPRTMRTTLTWDELRALSRPWLYVGAHTCSHPRLSAVAEGTAHAEIACSQEALRRELGRTWPIFAYPHGHKADLHPRLLDPLRREGFELAVSMIEGHNVLGRTPPLMLRRIGMTANLSLAEFRMTLTGAYNAYGAIARLRQRGLGVRA